jgi:hypothetical protein
VYLYRAIKAGQRHLQQNPAAFQYVNNNTFLSGIKN